VTGTWLVIATLTVGTLAMRAAGPLTTGGRQPSERAIGVTRLVAPAILAGLVVYETLNRNGDGIAFDARLAGLGAAVVAIVARAPVLVVVLVAAAATAFVRALA
jgi:Branched-chain amino acid transport protein (AzlD)